MDDTPTPLARATVNRCDWCGAPPGFPCIKQDAEPERLVSMAPGGLVHVSRIDQLVSDHPPHLTGAELIAAERQRQIDVEGWTPKHDASGPHRRGEMIMAAITYASAAHFVIFTGRDDGDRYFKGHPPHGDSFRWPWESEWWKPTWADPVRMLVKAGALIAAEIDRLQAKVNQP